jgi:hypothetical protein
MGGVHSRRESGLHGGSGRLQIKCSGRRDATNSYRRTGEELLLHGLDSKGPKKTICGFSHKQFTSDSRFIYFLSPAWAVSSGLHRYDTRTKAVTFVLDANDVLVLNDCKNPEYRDNLIVNQHRYFVAGGAYDWYFLFDSVGKKEKGPLGEYENEAAVRDAITASGLCDP